MQIRRVPGVNTASANRPVPWTALSVLLLGIVCTVPAHSGNPGKDYTIRVVEMSDDLALFEVSLPPREANRKGVMHKMFDDQGTEIASQRFSTANGRYRVAMIATYYSGRDYRLVIDGNYQHKFTYQPAS